LHDVQRNSSQRSALIRQLVQDGKEIIMAPWFHTAILATTLVATVAVGVAGASFYIGADQAAPKADRLPVVADNSSYVTVETRSADGVSVLHRVQVN
jgi:hypothetical protein